MENKKGSHVGYDIKPKPTTYNGRLYRSRLEARWAAFFDKCGWPYEYEPFDLPGWSPDFLLKGHYSNILVEVKPEFLINDSLKSKILNAVKGLPFSLLILSESPFDAVKGFYTEPEVRIGLGIQNNESPFKDDYPTEFENFIMKSQDDFSSQSGYWAGMMFGKAPHKNWVEAERFDHREIRDNWQAAGTSSMFLNPLSKNDDFPL